jgi:hypothetical protein
MRSRKNRVYVPAAKPLLIIGYILGSALIFWMAPEPVAFLGAPPEALKAPLPIITAPLEHQTPAASKPERKAAPKPEMKPRPEPKSLVESANGPSPSRTKPVVLPKTNTVAAPRPNTMAVPKLPKSVRTKRPMPSVEIPVNLPEATQTRVLNPDVNAPAVPLGTAAPSLGVPKVDLPNLPGQSGAVLASPGPETVYDADGWRQVPLSGNRHGMDQDTELLWIDVKRLLMNSAQGEFLTQSLRIKRTTRGNFLLFVYQGVNLNLALKQGLQQLRT